ncbi:hypothetical protein PIB30_048286 [Stylosanthes scabra]|uniref:Uncharacterized protein n=1 Tax=Stylosanthes scabra TaxID=79078 RepID=A0ABU6UIX5_9FABA|nr:hypothetical protein [Stylosanthes scabra]
MEIQELEKQKDELEEKLKKVNSLLLSARMRLHNAREERDQFNEASTEIVVHLKAKEDEMIRSISSYTRESNVVDTWVHFLENSLVHQTSHINKEKEQVKLENPVAPESNGSELDPMKKLQDEFLEVESKVLAILTTVDTIDKQFHTQREGIYRKDGNKVTKLLNAIKEIKDEFESIKRPKLKIEITPQKQEERQTTLETPTSQKKKTFMRSLSSISLSNRIMKPDEVIMSPSIHRRSKSAAVESLQMEVELDDLSDYDSAEEISEWEFDDVEQNHHTRS